MPPFTPKVAILIVIIIYTRPLWLLRYRFRSMVYGEKGWKINFRPWFWKEIKTLLSNRGLNKSEVRLANQYRIYLLGFAILWFIFSYI